MMTKRTERLEVRLTPQEQRKIERLLWWREGRLLGAKNGRRTHRDILKEDIEYCLSLAGTWEQFEQQLRGLGYTIDWQRFSVKAKDWERAVRLDRMGYPQYAGGHHRRKHLAADSGITPKQAT